MARPDVRLNRVGDLPLFRTGRATQAEAAAKVAPHANGLREQVFRCILAAGAEGVTRSEIEARTGILKATVCGRVNELLGPAVNPRSPFPQRVRVSGRRENARGYAEEVLAAP